MKILSLQTIDMQYHVSGFNKIASVVDQYVEIKIQSNCYNRFISCLVVDEILN